MVTSTSPDSFTTFGDLLRYLRRRLQITQTDLALAVGYSREQIVKLEHNQRRPDPTTILALFIPALELQREPWWAERLITLAQRDESPPLLTGLQISHERTNLPLALTSFIGRTSELAALQTLVNRHRLVTVVGAGGMGKTRLAQEVGRRMVTEFADGVWFVELASLTDAAHLPITVAAALGLTVVREPLTAVFNHLRAKQLLLILDNCEHLIAACVPFAEQLLQIAPRLHILATSREAFGVLSAITWRIPPMTTHEAGAESDAVALFANRAATVRSDFTLTPNSSPIIAHICRELDGMPLAIELAATRTRAVTVTEIAERLHEHFTLMTGGNRTALPRHQTLRAALEWSYALLSEREQALFRATGVFVGGFTSEVLAAVVDETHVTDTLLALVDKSLVNSDQRTGRTRYSLLETVRTYALTKLDEYGDSQTIHEHHALAFADYAALTRPMLMDGRQMDGFRRLDRELDNIRAAMGWTVAHAQVIGLSYIASLWWYWFRRGHWREGVEWADKILNHEFPPDTPQLARALIGACQVAGVSGDYERMMRWANAGRLLATAENDHEALALAVPPHAFDGSDYGAAKPHFLQGIAHAQAIGSLWLEADILSMFGDRARMAGEWDEAERLYRRSATLFQKVGDRDLICNPIGNLGRLAFEQGDLERARAAFEESIAICRAVGNPISLSDWLRQLAIVAYQQSDTPMAQEALHEGTHLCFLTGNSKGLADYLVLAVEIEYLPAFTATINPTTLHRALALLAGAEQLLEQNALYRKIDPASYTDFDRVSAILQKIREHSSFHDTRITGAQPSLDELVSWIIQP